MGQASMVLCKRGMAMGLAIGAVALMVGCGDDPESNRPSTTQPISRYESKGKRQVPAYLQGTIYEIAELQDTKPFQVSGFGLVTHLRQTGDNTAIPTPVRDWMVKQMQVHGFGSHRVQGYEHYSPEEILRNKSTAVVRVDGFVPPGARKSDQFDVLVSALEESYTSSLSHGMLYLTDLKYMGATSADPMISVNVYAQAEGPIFVNPAYALRNPKDVDATAKASLRYGVVMHGGVSTFDNPLVLRVRDPQFSTARAIERRINQRFQGVADRASQVGGLPAMAAAQDEALINFYVPRSYKGNWEHYAGVVKHLYLRSDPGFLATKAVELGDAAVTPNAPLENISYALEGIGEPALGVLSKLMKNPSPDVAYAAARAAASIGDETGEARDLLVTMAKTPEHPYRISAVKVLAEMSNSLEIAQYLRQLVNCDSVPVRIEAYKALAERGDGAIFSRVINEKFVLDIIRSSGQPMIYASRRGIPRIALFGSRQSLQTPMTFSALNTRLMLTADKPEGPMTLFYRAETQQGDPVNGVTRQLSRPDLADVIARLGGEASPDEPRFDFSYADIVALVQVLNDSGRITAMSLDGKPVSVLLNVEERTAQMADAAGDAPRIPDAGRAQDANQDATVPQIPDTKEAPAAKESKPAAPTGRQN